MLYGSESGWERMGAKKKEKLVEMTDRSQVEVTKQNQVEENGETSGRKEYIQEMA